MTVMEQTDIYGQVRWLLSNSEFPFSSVHWQLNAGFWKNDFLRRDFERWTKNSYNPGVHALVRFWVDYTETNGVVLKLYPILGIAQSLLRNEESTWLRCGGGWISYAIQTDGYIIPCPTMWGIRNYYVGHISTANPLRLKRVFVDKPCTQCDVYGLCGGRCLYALLTKRWTPEAYSQVCDTVRSLLRSIREHLPRLHKLIQEGRVEQKDFEYAKYNGCEIIP
jgi:radical SAM protein with 4Fe4S-binding SPASM domain